MSRSREYRRDPRRVFTMPAVWLAGLAACTAIGFLLVAYKYLDDLSRNHTGTLPMRLLEEGTGAYTAVLIFPLVVFLAVRFPVRRDTWAKVLPIHLLAAAVISSIHTTLMWGTRVVLAPLLGMGPYDYGNMHVRYFMEYPFFLFVYAFMLISVYLYQAYQDARDREVRSAELETQLAQAQLQNLRLQLQPHFLFNSLNTISSVMYEDVHRADAMLAQLSELLRKTLQPAESQQVPLADELAMLKLYLGIMQERFGKDLQVNFVVEPQLDDAVVPQLILQPLVENSIRHGRDAESRVQVEVAVARQNGHLVLRVSDHGPGIAGLAQGEWRKGIGLSNTAERLESMYGAEHRFALENAEGGGLSITMEIPFRTVAKS
jgi:two-component system, LytTR family, sensor kinase